jgi:pimeloyl-ACP methyl ester carboxylesterase
MSYNTGPMTTTGLHIEEIGAGRPLVLLHGCPGWGGSWRRIAQRLQDRRVLMPDMPGYGTSPRLQEAYAFDRVREGLEDALLERGVTHAAVVGFSLGGYRALELALSGRVKVTHLVLIGALADLDEAGRTMRIEGSRGIRGAETIDTPELRELMRTMVAPGYPEREEARFREILDWLKHADVDGFADEVGGMGTMPSLLERLHGISVPVHLLHGALDAVLPVATSEAIAARIDGAQLEVLPGIGHAVPVEAEDETVRAIRARA